jgi:catechol 2,3-dioxygenase-like lactoylglutathione lyase family enzyme
MLGRHEALATVAVTDLEVARKFYRETLGLEPVGDETSESSSYRTGNASILVYRSRHAGTNQATAVTWMVGDQVDGIVRALGARGVAFEHYDLPGLVLAGDVHVADGFKVAWFKDPDGNIHSLVSS